MENLKLKISGRINRKNFLIGQLLIVFLLFILGFVYYLIIELEYLNFFTYLLSVIFPILLCVFNLIISIRRLHDIEMNGFWVLLSFVPIVGIFLLLLLILKKGSKNKNKYGNPDENSFIKNFYIKNNFKDNKIHKFKILKFAKFLMHFLPDIMVQIGILILASLKFRKIIYGSKLRLITDGSTSHHNYDYDEIKIIAIMLIAVGLNILIRRLIKRNE